MQLHPHAGSKNQTGPWGGLIRPLQGVLGSPASKNHQKWPPTGIPAQFYRHMSSFDPSGTFATRCVSAHHATGTPVFVAELGTAIYGAPQLQVVLGFPDVYGLVTLGIQDKHRETDLRRHHTPWFLIPRCAPLMDKPRAVFTS